MANFARIIDNVAVDVSTDPAAEFHPLLAREFAPVPDNVARGWVRDGKGQWHAPVVAVPVEAEAGKDA